jgi:hypothetical protein
MIGFIRFFNMQGVPVSIGINRHAFDAKLCARPCNAYRHFATIGD